MKYKLLSLNNESFCSRFYFVSYMASPTRDKVSNLAISSFWNLLELSDGRLKVFHYTPHFYLKKKL